MSSVQGRPQVVPKNQKRFYQPAAPDPGFVVKVEEIVPDYEIQPPRSQAGPHGFFNPPDRRNALKTRLKFLFRYRNGVLREIAQNDPVRAQGMEFYDAATVFSQARGTDNLLTVPFDARTRNVSECGHDWKCLGFEYKPAQNGDTYASLAFIGEEEGLPANVPAWGKLIPQPYRYQKTNDKGNPIPSETSCAGLIGKLPLLIALAAFSAQPDGLRNALTTSRSESGRWVPHNFTTGRIPERGLVVTIYRDPQNPAGSTVPILENLENGIYGPFYAP